MLHNCWFTIRTRPAHLQQQRRPAHLPTMLLQRPASTKDSVKSCQCQFASAHNAYNESCGSAMQVALCRKGAAGDTFGDTCGQKALVPVVPASRSTCAAHQPTSLRAKLGACQPANQPASEPTSPPASKACQPASKPCQPASQPSSLPTSQPASQPAGQPASLPAKLASLPTSLPAKPASLPASQTACEPTSLPASQPACQPAKLASQPSLPAKLASQPACQPSLPARPSAGSTINAYQKTWHARHHARQQPGFPAHNLLAATTGTRDGVSIKGSLQTALDVKPVQRCNTTHDATKGDTDASH